MPRTSEHDIAEAVIKYLQTIPTREAEIRDIIENLPRFIHLTAEDEAGSETRTGESLWEQSVRNIVSHKSSPGNAIYEGRLGYRKPATLFIP